MIDGERAKWAVREVLKAMIGGGAGGGAFSIVSNGSSLTLPLVGTIVLVFISALGVMYGPVGIFKNGFGRDDDTNCLDAATVVDEMDTDTLIDEMDAATVIDEMDIDTLRDVLNAETEFVD